MAVFVVERALVEHVSRLDDPGLVHQRERHGVSEPFGRVVELRLEQRDHLGREHVVAVRVRRYAQQIEPDGRTLLDIDGIDPDEGLALAADNARVDPEPDQHPLHLVQGEAHPDHRGEHAGKILHRGSVRARVALRLAIAVPVNVHPFRYRMSSRTVRARGPLAKRGDDVASERPPASLGADRCARMHYDGWESEPSSMAATIMHRRGFRDENWRRRVFAPLLPGRVPFARTPSPRDLRAVPSSRDGALDGAR
jgi:hypothetical protein